VEENWEKVLAKSSMPAVVENGFPLLLAANGVSEGRGGGQ